ncbi:Zinc finger CCCH domain-containing protein [Quillaja saponaria]|uniref:Zinc finger CCCH domain-containing protein n=1 Tax=Quillaja saponaria TaxID=32244 RepID=A0AAD7VHB0_QUISA|nr:Zinc finger CCCH domain-containing protein [Quillaja saponaria]
MDVDGANKRVFQRLGRPSTDTKQQKVCYHWRAGKCNKHPCHFLHRELPPPLPSTTNGMSSKRPHGFADDSGFPGPPRRSPNFNSASTWGRARGGGVVAGDSFSLLTQLEGHQKVVSAIALPSGSDKLYTGGKDETVRIWDCQSGQCALVINLGGEVGCMISEGPWVFVGIPNFVKAWNTQTSTELSLSGPVGQVYALVVGNDLLFAGTQDGSILAWKFNAATNCFEPVVSRKDHSLAVISLVVGANRLYSGSMDHTIRVWNLETLQCVQTLTEHTSVVMSVLCWDQFLLSCSLDKTIKVWVANETGNLEVTYSHSEEHGLLTLCGMHDLQAKPILLCSCNDNSVRLYDLPSFSERGKIFAKEEVRAIQTGPGGIFFTGVGTGEVKVWKWSTEPITSVQ